MFVSNTKLVFVTALLAGTSSAQTLLNTDLGFGMDDAEITPDGRYAVVRENSADTTVRVYDLSTGQLVTTQVCSVGGTFSGAAQDAIAVTNTRAVLIGSLAMVLDLTNLTSPVLAEHQIGESARDVAITPDGTLAVIRGGESVTGSPGGLFVIDLATGALAASHAGEPGDPFPVSYTYDVDSVVVSNQHAVCTSIVDPTGTPKTRVLVWNLHPSAGGAPQVALETVPVAGIIDQLGAPHDIAISPDGSYAAVRSEFEVGLYHLNGALTTRVWLRGLFGNPGPMGLHNMDSIEMTNTRVVTACRFSNGSLGAQLDLFDLAGNQSYGRMRGDPHDLTLTPAGTRALVRTTKGAYLYDITSVPAGQALAPLARDETLTSTHTYYLAGLDSITATDETALVVARSTAQSTVRFYDIRNDTLQIAAQGTLPDRTLDVAISPDQRWAAVIGTSYVQVYDFTNYQLVYSYDPVSGEGWFPWCDGVAIDNDHLVAFGAYFAQVGWVSVIDLFSQPSNYCTAGTNSTGVGATIHATGTASIASNNLRLVAADLPAGALGFFVYATQQLSVPFGPGFVCVGGQRYKMPLATSTNGVAVQLANYNGTNAFGGAISAGTTWNFQFRYRDVPSGGVLNLTDALSVAFVP